MADKAEQARQLFLSGANCAQAVLGAFHRECGLDFDAAMRLASGFGGGMQHGTTCGAVVAAVCALGAVTGRTEPGEDRTPSAAAVREFLKKFEAEFGTLNCRELQATYVKEHALKSEGMYRHCTVFVEKAVALAEEILAAQPSKV